jgi:hypothetical protein
MSDKHLQVVLPEETVNALKHAAVDSSTTARSVVLHALQMAGYPVPNFELGDRRKNLENAPEQMSLLTEVPMGRVISIDSELASKMLATSPGNRSLRKNTVSHYAHAMARGEWRVGQAIEFDCLGQLRNGHHRLNAVIAYGHSVDFMVVTGLPEDVFATMDIGLNRTMGDLLQFPKELLQEASFIYRIISNAQKPTPNQIQLICQGSWAQNSAALDKHCPTRRKIFSTTAVRVAALYVMGKNPQWTQYVLDQFRALVLMDVDVLSPRCRSFMRYCLSNKWETSGYKLLFNLVRSIRAFDFDQKDVGAILIQQQTFDSVIEQFRKDAEEIFNCKGIK